ncbi:MAG: sugar nucleotide-binding protein [bacterium]
MKKILVLGSNGMAGHVVTQTFIEAGYDVDNLTNTQQFNDKTVIMDLTDGAAFDEYLDKNSYDVIVNCVGILVELSDKRKDLSSYLNSYLPHYLEYKYKDTKTKIIHMSTDCVFSGDTGPYREDSPYDGQLFYDRSKALGEIINDKDLTFRMSIIGPDMQVAGVGLFNWFYAQTGQIFGYTKSMWTGVTTIHLAKAMVAATEQNLTGLYHLVPDKNISKYDLVSTFKEVFNRTDIEIEAREGVVADKSLLNTRSDFDFAVPSYEVMIKDMKKWVIGHKEFYPHYKIKE